MVNSRCISPEITRAVGCPLVYSNLQLFGEASFVAQTLQDYLPRSYSWPELSLGRYPKNTFLDTLQGYLVVSADTIVAEQLAPWTKSAELAIEEVRVNSKQAENIERPVLLAARYGETTWGHWLLEMLPKIVLAEKTFPGLFYFAVPEIIVNQPEKRPRGRGKRCYADAILETIESYGISRDRILKIGSTRVYRFDNLFDVVGLTSGTLINPFALSELRSLVTPGPSVTGSAKIAILRNEGDRRSILNQSNLRAELQSLGFVLVDLVSSTFQQQVEIFRNASVVVGELGSGLAGLAFAPQGVNVITIAPANWRDGYFTPLLQLLASTVADIRGPSTFLLKNASLLPREPANCSYCVSSDDVIVALRHLDYYGNKSSRSPATLVSGRLMPYNPGPPVAAFRFGSGGNLSDQLLAGWSTPEEGLQWTIGEQAELRFNLKSFAGSGILLEIVGEGFIATPYYTGKDVYVDVNGTEVAQFIATNSFREFFHIRAEIWLSRAVAEVTFRHSMRPSPRIMGRGDDARELGIGLREMNFYDPDASLNNRPSTALY